MCKLVHFRCLLYKMNPNIIAIVNSVRMKNEGNSGIAGVGVGDGEGVGAGVGVGVGVGRETLNGWVQKCMTSFVRQHGY